MTREERQLIEALFERLDAAGRSPRDPEADDLIWRHLRDNPGAAYAMAQTILMQNQALAAAEARITNLAAEGEAVVDKAPGDGAWTGFAGESEKPAAGSGRRGAVPSVGSRTAAGLGGGFLATAASVAMGVAGGALLADAVRGMAGGDAASEAQSAEAAPADEAGADDTDVADAGGEEGGGGFFDRLFGGGQTEDTEADMADADMGGDDFDFG